MTMPATKATLYAKVYGMDQERRTGRGRGSRAWSMLPAIRNRITDLGHSDWPTSFATPPAARVPRTRRSPGCSRPGHTGRLPGLAGPHQPEHLYWIPQVIAGRCSPTEGESNRNSCRTSPSSATTANRPLAATSSCWQRRWACAPRVSVEGTS